MFKKSSVWLVVLISVVAIAFIASGCAKKQVIKEEMAATPAVEAKKAEAKPEAPKVMEKPKTEVYKPESAPVVEKPKEETKLKETKPEAAKPEEKLATIELASLRIQFAFDDYTLSGKAKVNLEKIASWMPKNPTAKIQIEGHACEIGTNEYNIALGERRANSGKKYLEGLGVSPARISTISYGEERPLDPGHTEEALARNRRDEFVQIK